MSSIKELILYIYKKLLLNFILLIIIAFYKLIYNEERVNCRPEILEKFFNGKGILFRRKIYIIIIGSDFKELVQKNISP